MNCPRLDHFVFIRQTNKSESHIERCCQMVDQPSFDTIEDMESSDWLRTVKNKFAIEEWPDECRRCRHDEESRRTSIREWAIEAHPSYSEQCKDYYVAEVKVDTKCNAACQICNVGSSSLIAKLNNVPMNKFEGLPTLATLDKNRIVQLDLVGGEPAVSDNVRQFLLTDIDGYNISTLRINSNGSSKIPGIERLLAMGKNIEITLSMDGTGSVFEYCRWPIKWSKFTDTVDYYKSLRGQYPNLNLALWTTHSALSIAGYLDAMKYAMITKVPLNGSELDHPEILALSKNNFLTKKALETLGRYRSKEGMAIVDKLASESEDTSAELIEFIRTEDAKRGINFDDYYKHLGTQL